MNAQENAPEQIQASALQKARNLMISASKTVIEYIFKELETTQTLINQARLYLANLEIWENFKELGPSGFLIKVKELYQSRGGIWSPTVEFCTENFFKVAQTCKSGLKAVAECLLKGKNKIHEHMFEVWEFIRQQESVNGTFENFLKILQVKLTELQEKVKAFKIEEYLPQIKVFYSVAVMFQLKQLMQYAWQQFSAFKGKTYETFEDFKTFFYVSVDFMALQGLKLLDIKSVENVKNFVIQVYFQVQTHLQKKYQDLDQKIKELIEKVNQSELPQNIQEKIILFLTWCDKEDAKQKLEEWWDELDQDEDGIVKVKDIVESVVHLVLLIFNRIPSKQELLSLVPYIKQMLSGQQVQSSQNQEETSQFKNQYQSQQEEESLNQSQNSNQNQEGSEKEEHQEIEQDEEIREGEQFDQKSPKEESEIKSQ